MRRVDMGRLLRLLKMRWGGKRKGVGRRKGDLVEVLELR